MKLSITSLYIISNAPKYDKILAKISNVIDSFISDIEVHLTAVCAPISEIYFSPASSYLASRVRTCSLMGPHYPCQLEDYLIASE